VSEIGEPAARRVSLWDVDARKPGSDETQVEGRFLRDLAGVHERLGVSGMQTGHLCG
jgi:hypothetical protein